MIKSLLAATICCVFSMGASAEAFHVEYIGFYDAEAAAFLPDAKLELYFKAEDTNQDGTYSLNELQEFGMGRIYVSDENCSLFSCVYDFSYTPGALPAYGASFYMSDERFAFSTTVQSGVSYGIFDRYIESPSYSSTWTWTTATKTWINGVPVTAVPEPATYAMLGLGLAGMLAAGRRRASKA